MSGSFCGTAYNGVIGVLQAVNNCTIVGGIPLLFTGILFFLWIIIFYRGKDQGTRDAITTAGFVTVISAGFLRLMELIPDQILGIAVVVFVLGMVGLYNRPEG